MIIFNYTIAWNDGTSEGGKLNAVSRNDAAQEMREVIADMLTRVPDRRLLPVSLVIATCGRFDGASVPLSEPHRVVPPDEASGEDVPQ